MAVSAQPTRVRRVLLALVIAVVFIFGAYLLSNPNTFAPSTANAESTQALLEAYAQKTGPDGLPLWEEQLIATASSTAWANVATTTSYEDTVPAPGITPAAGSLTDEFAQNLFGQYLSQDAANDPSEDDINTVAQEAIQTLVQNNEQQNPYSLSEVRVSEDTSSSALLTYAASVDAAIDAHSVAAGSDELTYFSAAVERGDYSGLTTLASIGSAYTALAQALMKIEVPSYAENAHLEIANGMAKLGADITDMSTMQTDPLRAYLGFNQYETDGPALLEGYGDMYTVFKAQGVSIPENKPGGDFYSVLSITAPQGSTSQ